MENISLYLLAFCFCAAVNDVIDSRYNKSHYNSKIVGGQEVSIYDCPYQVHILIRKGRNFHNVCGGTILSYRFVMTAAHCVTRATRLYIRAGSTDSDSGGQMYSSSMYIMHPQYNPCTYDFDIAIVRLLRPMRLDGVTTRTIQLPDANFSIQEGSDVFISGWGFTSEDGDITNTLMAVTVPVTSFSYCNQSYDGSITSRMFCAGQEQGGKDSCQGDSGGPVVQQNLQIGIVSWGYGCARPGKPGVYTNVAHLRRWIKQVTGL